MPIPHENQTRTCPNCGEPVPPGAKQCPSCGQVLGTGPRSRWWWLKSLTPTEIFLLVIGSLMLSVFLVAV
ncbi:zinc-ribbon domain-containing protein [Pontibacter sp. E15-1]|uniref:zinc-ribbon domain-containing protein n=1 Tax=Pontibacter sp. E15-1 TaxID=2919918 RepID=UPI001F502C70|nr:zinc-ribbon domain-containing protein [Pontibacter sp. E15-1]MCJ8163746.1 zinc-ribbon domain-containing protein [Pontibacter sp. E15-1]